MEKRDIKEKMLKDVREDEIFEYLTLKEKDGWENNPEERLDLYLREKKRMGRDAERWPKTLDSYQEYQCFSFAEKPTPGKYFVVDKYDKYDKSYVRYCKDSGAEVKLSADLLTNEGQIREAVKKAVCKDKDGLFEKNVKVLEAFYRVAYTIGNFCLTWKNPGGPKGSDICWRKLAQNDEFAKKKLEEGKSLNINEREDIASNLSKRKFEDLFMILPLENPREVIKQLYLQDYYNDEWELRWSTQNVNDLKPEKLLEFIKDITILIVQRSYRIICNCTDKKLTEEDQSYIKVVLKEIGLSEFDCI